MAGSGATAKGWYGKKRAKLDKKAKKTKRSK